MFKLNKIFILILSLIIFSCKDIDEDIASYNADGSKLLAQGKFNEAIDKFSKSIDLKKHDSQGYILRASAYLLKGMDEEKTSGKGSGKGSFSKGIKDLDKVIKDIDSELTMTYLIRGQLYNASGEYQKAEADYNKTVKLNSKLVLAYIYRSLNYISQSNTDKANEDCKIANSLNPKVPVSAPCFVP